MTDTTRTTAAYNLTQTLLQTTTLILCGLAVAFAFRCGMFNIGGQGQYFVGLDRRQLGRLVVRGHGRRLPHILLAIGAATLAGALWARHRRLPEGDRRRPRGDLDDHAQLDRDLGRRAGCSATAARCRTRANTTVPISNDVARRRSCPSSGATQALQGLHVGFFVALAALVVFWLILNRTTLGYEVRAVGFNPEAARVRRHQRAEELLPGDGDLGRVRRARRRRSTCSATSTTSAVSTSRRHSVGFLGIAVALLGRNTAVGTGLAALLFGALLYGTTHGLDSNVFEPELAGNLTLDHPGARRALRRRRRPHPLHLELAPEAAPRRRRRTSGGGRVSAWTQRLDNPLSARLRDPAGRRLRRHRCSARSPRSWRIPPIKARTIDLADRRRHRSPSALGIWTVSRGRRAARLGRGRRRGARDRARHPRDALEHGQPRHGLQRRR